MTHKGNLLSTVKDLSMTISVKEIRASGPLDGFRRPVAPEVNAPSMDEERSGRGEVYKLATPRRGREAGSA